MLENWAVALLLFGLNVLLIYVASPPRVLVLARMLRERDGTQRLRLALQNLEPHRVDGPIELTLDVGDTPEVPPRILVHAGPEFRARDSNVRVRFDPVEKQVVVKARRMRALKTWVFDIQLSGLRDEVGAELRLPRRSVVGPLGDAVQLLGRVYSTFGDIRVPILVTRSDVDDEDDTPNRFKPFVRDDMTILVVSLLLHTVGYLGLTNLVGGRAWTELDPLDLGAWLVSTALVIGLFFTVRPRPTPVVQGFLHGVRAEDGDFETVGTGHGTGHGD